LVLPSRAILAGLLSARARLKEDVMDKAAGMTTSERLPMTDAEIRAVTVGEIAPPARITLAEYDPAWPVLYAREAARIRAALGDRALLLEHVGSTSVPGLAAKPRIDVLLVVADSTDEAAYVPALEAAGYVLHIREPDWFEHRLFKGPDTAVNLHVFSPGCTETQRMLRFRDHLRRDETDRQLYERTKRALADRVWTHTQNYADAKSGVIDEILARAAVTGADPEQGLRDG
jgi:GrpB-like predicted nucleotidyltransferase (UPF0157 family)